MLVTLRKHLLTLAISSALVGGVVLGVFTNYATAAQNSLEIHTHAITDFSAATNEHTFSAASTSQSNITIPTGLESYTYETGPIEAEDTFNAFGIRYTGNIPSEDTISFTVEADGQSVEMMPLGDDLRSPLKDGTYATKPVVFDSADSFSLTVELSKNAYGQVPSVDSLEFVYYDTRSPRLFGATNFTQASTERRIISREEWGADEDLRYTTRTTRNGNTRQVEIWEPDYATEADFQDHGIFVVHHTAGSDGGSDPAASVRAIYAYHAVTLGWGDIGYNYLIDPNGNIYEGRHGGDLVEGGHTYNSSTNTSYNDDSVGIALMGCFEGTSGACGTEHTMTTAMENSLAWLIGTISAEKGFDPRSSVTYKEADTKRIVGHRDLDYTYCPGSHVHDELVTVRRKAQSYYVENALDAYSASFGSINVGEERSLAAQSQVDSERIALATKEKHYLTLSYTNTGYETWERDTTFIKMYTKRGSSSPLRHASWPNSLGKVLMNENSIEPGETATFSFYIKKQKRPKRRALMTKLYSNGTRAVGSKHTSKFSFEKFYVAKHTENTVPIALARHQEQDVSFTVKNTGTKTWGEDVEVYWYGSPVMTLDAIGNVAPGEEKTITFPFIAKRADGKPSVTRKHIFKLKYNDETIRNSRQAYFIRID